MLLLHHWFKLHLITNIVTLYVLSPVYFLLLQWCSWFPLTCLALTEWEEKELKIPWKRPKGVRRQERKNPEKSERCKYEKVKALKEKAVKVYLKDWKEKATKFYLCIVNFKLYFI